MGYIFYVSTYLKKSRYDTEVHDTFLAVIVSFTNSTVYAAYSSIRISYFYGEVIFKSMYHLNQGNPYYTPVTIKTHCTFPMYAGNIIS